MSWLRSAMNKAAEVGGKTNLTRTVRTYADTVVHHAGQAVAGGAKIFQERMGIRNYRSFRQTVKRLEEVAISCRGAERVQLLRRWLAALKEIEKMSVDPGYHRYPEKFQSLDEPDSLKNSSLVLFFDSDMEGEPMNFRDVFLHSQALEGITISMHVDGNLEVLEAIDLLLSADLIKDVVECMLALQYNIILEAPNEEEVSLLLDIFRLCISGGTEVHNAIVSSIQDLAKAFSSYQDEVLVKQEELLQFAQSAISGLKLNADVARLDAEAAKLEQKINKMKALQVSSAEANCENSGKAIMSTVEDLKEALAEVRLCYRLEELLLKKKSIDSGDSLEIHSQKVDKLKVLEDSLANSSAKAEKRIADHRLQKEEALTFRAAKANEVSEVEKELGAELAVLEKQRDELEAKMEKINLSLTSIVSRLNKMKEERDQFDKASEQVVFHLKAKEDELSRSVASCNVEVNVVHTWINFLEDTRLLQSSYTESKEKQINDELEKYESCFVKLIKYHLEAFKEELGPSIGRISTFVNNIQKLNERSKETTPSVDKEHETHPRKFLEDEYLETETKVDTIFAVVDHMKILFYSKLLGSLRKEDDLEIKELFGAIEKAKAEFETIERPTLEIEIPANKALQPAEKAQEGPSHSPQTNASQSSSSLEPKASASSTKSMLEPTEQPLDPELELAKLELEFGKGSQVYSTEDIGGWEFDEIEQELKSEAGK